MLLQEVSAQHPVAALGVLIGSMGLLFSGFRLMAVFTGGKLGSALFRDQPGGETNIQTILISLGITALLVVGVIPRVFFPMMVGILSAFGLDP